MRMRRGMAIAVVASGGAATTLLVGLVTNAVSETSNWPSWLGWMQRHAWLSFALLGLALVGFTAMLAALSDIGPERGRAEPVIRPDDGTGTPGSALVLRSLPRDTTAFTNRSTELERLQQSVEASQARGEPLPVHVIDGTSGRCGCSSSTGWLRTGRGTTSSP